MNKEMIMQGLKITSEEFDKIYNEQFTVLRSKFPSLPEDIVKKMATKTVKAKVLRNKLMGKQELELLVIGMKEATRFNRIRIYMADKHLSTLGVDKGRAKCIQDKLMDEDGNYLDNFGGKLDKKNPNANDVHIIYAIDDKSNFFVLSLKEDFLSDLEIGKTYKFEIQKSKSTKEYFGMQPLFVNDMSIIKEDIPLIEINSIIKKFTTEKLSEHIKIIESDKQLTEDLIRKDVAISMSIVDITNNNYNFEIVGLIDDSMIPIKLTFNTAFANHTIGKLIQKDNKDYVQLYIVGQYDGFKAIKDDEMYHWIKPEFVFIDNEYIIEEKTNNINIEIKGADDLDAAFK